MSALRSNTRSEHVDITLFSSGEGSNRICFPLERTRMRAGNKYRPFDTVALQRTCSIIIATADTSAIGIHEGEFLRFFLDGISSKNPRTQFGKRHLMLLQCCTGLKVALLWGCVPSWRTHAIPAVGQDAISAPRPTVQNSSSAIRAICLFHHVGFGPHMATIAEMKVASIAALCFFVFTDMFRNPFASIRTKICESRGGSPAISLSKFTARLADSTVVDAPLVFLATFARKARATCFDLIASVIGKFEYSRTYSSNLFSPAVFLVQDPSFADAAMRVSA